MMISFLGPIKNDWGKVPALLDSIRRMFKIGSYEIILVDDGSDLTNQQILSNVVSKYPEITLLKNENTLGVIASVNRISKAARGDLLIPINADIRFRSRFYLFYIIFVFSIFRSIQFCFMKTRSLDQDTGKVHGVVGWAPKKGRQSYKNVAELVASGIIRVAGDACAYRKEWFIKSGGYDESLGPTADFYINHLAVLQGSAWYSGKIATDNLVRANSYTSSVSAEKYEQLMLMVVDKWEASGIHISEKEKKKLASYERTESLSNLRKLKTLGLKCTH